MGGDGRCSCSLGNPTGCGCPPGNFDKSGHIGGMIVARIGDTDDALCNGNGCADGDYFMRLNVAFQDAGNPDPVDQLENQFAVWRAALDGRPDAVATTVSFSRQIIPPNGISTTTMTITPLDFAGAPAGDAISGITVEHGATSAGLSTIGAVTSNGDGTFGVELTSGTAMGVDHFRVTIDDGIRPVVLMPEPAFEYFAPGDIDGDGMVATTDLLDLLALWGPCPAPCAADLDSDGVVGITDLLVLLGGWG